MRDVREPVGELLQEEVDGYLSGIFGQEELYAGGVR